MSGHSKWATTKHHKAAKDTRRRKLLAGDLRFHQHFLSSL